ncbi:MAG: peptidylprolyl isomerase [Clostridiales Family XIII bacterium]|nr:peptidylprolyl isomerase [Clostridiales Family XIII bacterium]
MKHLKMKRPAAISIAVFLAAVTLAASLAGCSAKDASSVSDKEETQVTDTKPIVEITMQDGGKIDIELDPSAAPDTVENFLKLVNEGFYDSLTFHRIIPGFMIQGGDPEGTGMGGADTTIKGEFSSNGVDNPISHKRGVISMARSQSPDSASSQFFITNADSVFLDGEYAAFGHVTSGMDVVDSISAVETSANDAPTSPVVIESIKQIK